MKSRPRNLRAAVRAYVLGHDRVRERDSKFEGEPRYRSASPEFGQVPRKPSFGVPVPERLRYHRGPDTWRDRSPESEASHDG